MRLALSGELDLSVAKRLTSRLTHLSRAGAVVDLDLSNLEFIDSTGIAAIVGAFRNAQLGGWDFSVAPEPTPQVRRVITLVGLDEVLWPAESGALCAERLPDARA